MDRCHDPSVVSKQNRLVNPTFDSGTLRFHDLRQVPLDGDPNKRPRSFVRSATPSGERSVDAPAARRELNGCHRAVEAAGREPPSATKCSPPMEQTAGSTESCSLASAACGFAGRAAQEST